MPFESKAQQRFMFAKHPRIAKRWAKETSDIKGLPEKVSGLSAEDPTAAEIAVSAGVRHALQKFAAELTEARREDLSPKSFVFPKQKKYPIQDQEHARNALARVAQFGNKSMQAKVRSAVDRKYPGLELTEASKPVKTPTVKYSPPTKYPH